MVRYTIRNKLQQLAEAHDPPLTIAQIAEKTGVSNNTVRRWYNNDLIARYEREVVIAFCEYFQLQSIGELLELVIEGG